MTNFYITLLNIYIWLRIQQKYLYYIYSIVSDTIYNYLCPPDNLQQLKSVTYVERSRIDITKSLNHNGFTLLDVHNAIVEWKTDDIFMFEGYLEIVYEYNNTNYIVVYPMYIGSNNTVNTYNNELIFPVNHIERDYEYEVAEFEIKENNEIVTYNLPELLKQYSSTGENFTYKIKTFNTECEVIEHEFTLNKNMLDLNVISLVALRSDNVDITFDSNGVINIS
jgi:hypothetical protein